MNHGDLYSACLGANSRLGTEDFKTVKHNNNRFNIYKAKFSMRVELSKLLIKWSSQSERSSVFEKGLVHSWKKQSFALSLLKVELCSPRK